MNAENIASLIFLITVFLANIIFYCWGYYNANTKFINYLKNEVAELEEERKKIERNYVYGEDDRFWHRK